MGSWFFVCDTTDALWSVSSLTATIVYGLWGVSGGDGQSQNNDVMPVFYSIADESS